MPVAAYQQLLKDATISDADWNTLSDGDLDSEVFTTTAAMDALGRMMITTDPGGNKTEHTYEKDGALKTVVLNGDTYVQDIHHNAKGQREAIWYGNGTKTSYTYEPLTYRLSRLLTINLNITTHPVLQDLNYYYDPVGNITQIRDDAQQTLFFNNTVVLPTQKYAYDALYRLTQAQGREQIGTATFGAADNWNDSGWTGITHKGDGGAVQSYTQNYTYDEVGNILLLQHVAGSGSYSRAFGIGTNNNRLNRTTVGSTNYDYTHDARGNMTSMPHLAKMEYDSLNQMCHVVAASTEGFYQYSGGQRIRKWVEKSGMTEERIYLGNYELYRKFDSSSSLKTERSTVHVADDAGRIAMLEVANPDYTDDCADSLVRYIYSNHLGSSSLELDNSAEIISYEEYHPYGTTSYQAMNATIQATAKRYRFTGKERDEESGLNYHGARYYIPWLCRWAAVDPLESKYTPWSSYNYGFNNPVKWNDPTGMGPGYGDLHPSQVPTHDNLSRIPVRQVQPVAPASVSPIPSWSTEAPVSSYFAPVNEQHNIPKADKAKNGHVARQVSQEYKKEAAAKDKYMNEVVQYADIYGNGHIGPRKDVEATVNTIGRQHSDQVADMVAGGVFAAYGYMMNGEAGAQRGAIVDALFMSMSPNPQIAKGITDPLTLIQSPNVAYTERPLGGPNTLPDNIASTFMGGRYKAETTTTEIILYRAGEEGKPLGKFFSIEPPQGVLQTRIDKAILPIWPGGGESIINTGFEIKIPSGVTIFSGDIAPQGGIFLGGTQQIVVPQPWKILGVQVMSNFPLR